MSQLEALKTKINELKFDLIDDDGKHLHYSRQTDVGAPRDSTGEKVTVFLKIDKEHAIGQIAIEASNNHGHVTIEYDVIDPVLLQRQLKALERQVVNAWAEIAD